MTNWGCHVSEINTKTQNDLKLGIKKSLQRYLLLLFSIGEDTGLSWWAHVSDVQILSMPWSKFYIWLILLSKVTSTWHLSFDIWWITVIIPHGSGFDFTLTFMRRIQVWAPLKFHLHHEIHFKCHWPSTTFHLNVSINCPEWKVKSFEISCL